MFDGYLSDSFMAVLCHRPEMLRSGTQLSYEIILDSKDRIELIELMARRDLGEVSYKPVRAQAAYYERRFGVSLEVPQHVTQIDLSECMARRNTLVHNTGIVNAQYLGDVPW
jgi:hypothetical protein